MEHISKRINWKKKYELKELDLIEGKLFWTLCNSGLGAIIPFKSIILKIKNLNFLRYFAHRYYGFSVGKYSYGFESFLIPNLPIKKIGAFCSIANNVSIVIGNHPTNLITTSPITYKKEFYGLKGLGRIDLKEKKKNQKIEIGNDVWIGMNVTILPSVKIGNGVIIGAGSVITHDVPDYAVVAGVPAKIIKFRFSQEKIVKLNKICWWDWSDEKILQNLTLFIEPEKFFEKY